MTDAQAPLAELVQVSKTYWLDQVRLPIIQNVSLRIRPAQFTVLLGPSGSGKTTLLNLLACIDRPDQGEVRVAGQGVNSLSDDALSDFRAAHIGFIFQSFNLIPVLTAFENIEYPLVLAGMAAPQRRRRVDKLLDAVGLADRARNLPGQLSGGQRQRVAIARALARKPRLVIADEPTANLDSKTGAAIIGLLRHMQKRHQVSFVFSSHDRSLIDAADDLIVLRDGVIESVQRKHLPAADPASDWHLERCRADGPSTQGQPR